MSAVFSPDGTRRYRLDRHVAVPGEWHHGRALWVMLNPSTADESVDDPTIRRVVGFSRAWGLADVRRHHRRDRPR